MSYLFKKRDILALGLDFPVYDFPPLPPVEPPIESRWENADAPREEESK